MYKENNKGESGQHGEWRNKKPYERKGEIEEEKAKEQGSIFVPERHEMNMLFILHIIMGNTEVWTRRWKRDPHSGMETVVENGNMILQTPGHNKRGFVISSFQTKFCELSIVLARSGYRPQCFCSAALVGGYSDVTFPHRGPAQLPA
eukprot:1146414-Pelagomonas_calceolata.AAC.1